MSVQECRALSEQADRTLRAIREVCNESSPSVRYAAGFADAVRDRLKTMQTSFCYMAGYNDGLRASYEAFQRR